MTAFIKQYGLIFLAIINTNLAKSIRLLKLCNNLLYKIYSDKPKDIEKPKITK